MKKKQTPDKTPFKVWRNIGRNARTLSNEAITFLNSGYRREYEKLNTLEKTLISKGLIVTNYFPVITFVPSEIYQALEFYGDDYYLNKLKFYYNIHPCAKVSNFHMGHFNDVCPSFSFDYQTPTKFTFNYSTGTFYNGIQGGNKLRTIDIITPNELEHVFGYEYYIKMKLRKEYTWYDNNKKWEKDFNTWAKEDKAIWDRELKKAKEPKVGSK
jgi:hypothetical protein